MTERWGVVEPAGLLRAALQLTGKARPRLALVPTATGDDRTTLARLTARSAAGRSTCATWSCSHAERRPAHLLLEQDVIWVGAGRSPTCSRCGACTGSTRSCARRGRPASCSRVAAGSICWHLGGPTDSFGPVLHPVTDGLGLLPYGNGVHYDKEEQRRPLLHTLVADGTLPAVVRHRRHHRCPLRGHRAGRRPDRRHEGHRRLRRRRPRRTVCVRRRAGRVRRRGRDPAATWADRRLAPGRGLRRQVDHGRGPGGLPCGLDRAQRQHRVGRVDRHRALAAHGARDRRVEQVPPPRLRRHARDVVAARQPSPRRLGDPQSARRQRPASRSASSWPSSGPTTYAPALPRTRSRGPGAPARAPAHRWDAPRWRGSSATNTSSSAPPRRDATSA